jgi:uncharacterized membrane protein (UPF0127 family)
MKILTYLFLLMIGLGCRPSDRSTPPPGPETPAETTVTEGLTPDVETTVNVDPLEQVELVTPSGENIRVSLAYTSEDQQAGVSGIKANDFEDDEAKLFFYLQDATRTFWMPNTYFDLDIIYLSKDLEIIRIVPDVPHYTGSNSSEIPRAPAVKSRHVLEMRADSPIANKLKAGDRLEWKSPLTLQQTESKIRQQQ